jgi:hypothetical protein
VGVLHLHQLRGQAHKHIDFLGHSIVDKFEVVDDLHATLDLDATTSTFLEPTETLQLGDLKKTRLVQVVVTWFLRSLLRVLTLLDQRWATFLISFYGCAPPLFAAGERAEFGSTI